MILPACLLTDVQILSWSLLREDIDCAFRTTPTVARAPKTAPATPRYICKIKTHHTVISWNGLDAFMHSN